MSSVECTFEKRGGVFHPSTICSIFMVHIVVDDVPKLAKCKGYLGYEVLKSSIPDRKAVFLPGIEKYSNFLEFFIHQLFPILVLDDVWKLVKCK